MRKFIALFFIIAFLFAPAAFARDIVIALSPYQSPQSATTQVKTLIPFLTGLKVKDKVVLIDGYTLKTIGIFTVPEGKAYQSPKARIAKNRTVIAALVRFAKNAQATGGSGVPSISGAVRLPHLLRTIAQNFAPTSPLDVIVLGSPFYDDPKEVGFSMAQGIFPSDGHLKLSRANSPYGATDNPEQLQHLRVHLAYAGNNIFPTDQHHYYIQRFWTLYLEAQNGTLVSFTGDINTVFSRVLRSAIAPKHNHKINKADKPLMIRLQRDTGTEPIFDRALSITALDPKMVSNAPSVEIGLSWDCPKCDHDLYAKPNPEADILYYGHGQSSEGKHFKDFRQSPRRTYGYETIVFSKPIDLRQLQIGINFFSGLAPEGTLAEIRLSVNGQTFSQSFRLDAKGGNGGQGILQAFESGHAPNENIVMINPLRIVGIEP